jgi:hypothetical protein
MDDIDFIKKQIEYLKDRIDVLEERLAKRKRVRKCPCTEREKGTCNVYAGYDCPFDLVGINTKIIKK